MEHRSYYGLIELALSGAIALGFGWWSLRSVNREIARDKEKAARESGAARHAVGEHPLDDG